MAPALRWRELGEEGGYFWTAVTSGPTLSQSLAGRLATALGHEKVSKAPTWNNQVKKRHSPRWRRLHVSSRLFKDDTGRTVLS